MVETGKTPSLKDQVIDAQKRINEQLGTCSDERIVFFENDKSARLRKGFSQILPGYSVVKIPVIRLFEGIDNVFIDLLVNKTPRRVTIKRNEFSSLLQKTCEIQASEISADSITKWHSDATHIVWKNGSEIIDEVISHKVAETQRMHLETMCKSYTKPRKPIPTTTQLLDSLPLTLIG